jgi:hypothetical protein
MKYDQSSVCDKFQFVICRFGVVGKGAKCYHKEEKLY